MENLAGALRDPRVQVFEDVGIEFLPEGQTFVRNRIGCPELAKKDLGFIATKDLKQGQLELIEWRSRDKAQK